MWPQTFVRTLWKSISSTSYYLEVALSKLSQCFRFFLVSTVLLGAANGLYFSYFSLPETHRQAELSLDQVVTNYPSELVLSWDGQSLLRNGDSSQLISLPLPSFLQNDSLPQTFLSLVLSEKLDPSELDNLLKTNLLVVTRQNLHLIGGGNSQSSLELKKLPGFESSFTIDKQSIGHYVSLWKLELVAAAKLLKIVLPFVAPMWSIVVQTLVILVEVLFAFFFIRLLRAGWSFKILLKIGLHISVVSQVVSFLGDITMPGELPFFTITFWSYLIIVMLVLEKKRRLLTQA